MAVVAQSYKIVGKQVAKKSQKVTRSLKKRFIRYGLVSLNLVVLVGVVTFVFKNPTSSTAVKQNTLNQEANAAVVTNPLDELTSADIALQVARIARLPELTSVQNTADSQNAQLSIVASGAQTVTKPQVVSTALKSKKDIKIHIVEQGQTISSLSTQYGVTSDSIRWSNGLTGDTVQAGKRLYIPPVNGVVHEVVRGDTPESLATKYRANKDQIIADNDAEVSGLRIGDRVLIRDGTVPAPVVRYANFNTGGFAAYNFSGAYNGYDYGWCTWYVANKRIAAGRPLPTNLGNAGPWAFNAPRLGLPTGRAPAVGAAAVTDRSNPGHVAYVEEVLENGDIWISEMNSRGQVSKTDPTPAGGWGRVNWKYIPADRALTFTYIY